MPSNLKCEVPNCECTPRYSYMHYGKGVRYLCIAHKCAIINAAKAKGVTIPCSRLAMAREQATDNNTTIVDYDGQRTFDVIDSKDSD